MYDFIIIGAGPGGYEAALRAAALGKKVALIERGVLGGTCLNRGCVPTKALLHAAQLYREAVDGEQFGVDARQICANLPSMFAHKNAVVGALRMGLEMQLRRAGIDVLPGTGTILGPGRVRLASRTPRELSCRYIIAATGAAPARPNIPGLELALTSDTLLEGEKCLPKSLVIIGGGVIGVEFATFYSDLGCAVTILEGLDRLLPGMDRELGQGLAATLKKRGVTVLTNATVQALEQTDGGISVCYERRGKAEAVIGESVLCAIGRRPVLDGLFAEELKPDMEGHRLKVDSTFATSIPDVYAIGDLSSKVQLAHAATAQGVACVEHLLGQEQTTALSPIPACIYTRPEIATVGIWESSFEPLATAKALMGANARTLICSSDRGFVKLIAHAQTGALLGAELMCERATDLIAGLTEAITNHLTVEQMLRTIYPHPTFAEAIHAALRELEAKLS